MKYHEVQEILATSDRDDWLIDDSKGTFTYKGDLHLHIQREDEGDRIEFTEKWATTHPDKRAYKKSYSIRYGQSLLETKELVVVDGGRATLPMPRSEGDLVVSRKDAHFAGIVDSPESVEEYLNRSKITVE